MKKKREMIATKAFKYVVVFFALMVLSFCFQSCAGTQSEMEGYDDNDSYQPMSSQDIQEESFGQKAEEADKPRKALAHYVKALQSVSDTSPDDKRLRDKILKLAQKIQPPPATPNEVIKYEGAAEAAIRNAKNPEDYLDAAKKYRQALKIAPWIGKNYFNLGVVLEKAGHYQQAAQSYQYYLTAHPQADDAKDVLKKIGEFEYRAERLKANPAEILAGKWMGWVSFEQLKLEKEYFKIETDKRNFKIIYDSKSVDGFFQVKHRGHQLGSTLFELTIDGSNLNGKWFQDTDLGRTSIIGSCPLKKEQPVTGEVLGNGNKIILNFQEEHPDSSLVQRGSKIYFDKCEYGSLGSSPWTFQLERMQ